MVPSKKMIKNAKRNDNGVISYIGGLLDITTFESIGELEKHSVMDEKWRIAMGDLVNHSLGIPLDATVELFNLIKIFNDHCEFSSSNLDAMITNTVISYNDSKYIYFIETQDSSGYHSCVKTELDPALYLNMSVTKIAVNRQDTFNYFACQHIKTDSGEYGDDIYYWNKIDDILKLPSVEMYDYLMSLIMCEIQYYQQGKRVSSDWMFGDYVSRSIDDFTDPKRFEELVESGDPLSYEFNE